MATSRAGSSPAPGTNTNAMRIAYGRSFFFELLNAVLLLDSLDFFSTNTNKNDIFH